MLGARLDGITDHLTPGKSSAKQLLQLTPGFQQTDRSVRLCEAYRFAKTLGHWVNANAAKTTLDGVLMHRSIPRRARSGRASLRARHPHGIQAGPLGACQRPRHCCARACSRLELRGCKARPAPSAPTPSARWDAAPGPAQPERAVGRRARAAGGFKRARPTPSAPWQPTMRKSSAPEPGSTNSSTRKLRGPTLLTCPTMLESCEATKDCR